MEKKNEIQTRYGTAHDFALAFNPSIQGRCAKDIERSLYGEAPTLRQLSATYTEEQNKMWLMTHLNNLNNFCGVKSKMEVEQMQEVAAIILIEYPYLKASEVLLFFYRFKAGYSGQLYGSVDPLKITDALKDFIEWRVAERNRIENKRKVEKRNAMYEESKKNAITKGRYLRRKFHRMGLKHNIKRKVK